MGTFTSRQIVESIIEANGHGTGNPRLWYVKLVEYTTPEGETVWGGVLNVEVAQGIGDRYEVPSEYIRNPQVIWRQRPDEQTGPATGDGGSPSVRDAYRRGLRRDQHERFFRG